MAVNALGNAAAYIFPKNVEGTLATVANSADLVATTGAATTLTQIAGPL